MPPRKKEIPFDDVKGLKTLLEEGKQQGKSQEAIQQEIADYFHVSTRTVRRRIKEMEESEKNGT